MRLFNTPAGAVRTLRFAPDGRSLYLLSREAYESPWMPSEQLQWLPHLFQHAYRVDVISDEVVGEWQLDGSDTAIFAPDLRSVYHSVSVSVAGGDFDLAQTDLLTRKSRRVREFNDRGLSCLGFTPNGHILAAGGLHTSVHRLDVWHNAELEPIPVEAVCLAYSADGRLLATGSPAGVQVWDAKKPVAQWPGAAWRMAWTPDGRLAWASEETLCVARPGASEVRTWGMPHGRLSALAVSDCGRFVATGSARGSCSLHDLATGSVRGTFDWGIGTVHSVAFAPDGLTCAAGGESGQVVVWDVDG